MVTEQIQAMKVRGFDVDCLVPERVVYSWDVSLILQHKRYKARLGLTCSVVYL